MKVKKVDVIFTRKNSNKYLKNIIFAHAFIVLISLITMLLAILKIMNDYYAVGVQFLSFTLSSIYMFFFLRRREKWWKHAKSESEFINGWISSISKKMKKNVFWKIYLDSLMLFCTSFIFVIVTFAIYENATVALIGCLVPIIAWYYRLAKFPIKSNQYKMIKISNNYFASDEDSLKLAISLVTSKSTEEKEIRDIIFQIEKTNSKVSSFRNE